MLRNSVGEQLAANAVRSVGCRISMRSFNVSHFPDSFLGGARVALSKPVYLPNSLVLIPVATQFSKVTV